MRRSHESTFDLRIERPQNSDPQEDYRAARTVCHYASDATEAALLLAMLGLADLGASACVRCGQAPMRNADDYGRPLPPRDGMCGHCVNIVRQRARREAAQ